MQIAVFSKFQQYPVVWYGTKAQGPDVIKVARHSERVESRSLVLGLCKALLRQKVKKLDGVGPVDNRPSTD